MHEIYALKICVFSRINEDFFGYSYKKYSRHKYLQTKIIFCVILMKTSKTANF